MRVFSFSVLLGLSQVGKAESNDEGQFPGFAVAEEEFEPAVENHDSWIAPVVYGNLKGSSNMEKLLQGAVVVDDVTIPHELAVEKCNQLGMQLPVPESEYDVGVLARYAGEHDFSYIWLGLRRISDDGNGPFYNIYTGQRSEVESAQHTGDHWCAFVCGCHVTMIMDYFCNQRNSNPFVAVCVPGGVRTTSATTTSSTTTTTTTEKGRCMNDHWTYNEDTEQCEPDADLSSIACGSTDMTISIHKAFVYEAYNGDVPSTITIGNKGCTSTWDADKMAVFKVNFNDECGQDIYHEDGTISISIDLDRSSSKEVDGVAIFTSQDDNMIWTFTCSYDDVISTKDSLEVSVSTFIGATTLHTAFPADAFPMDFVNVDAPSDPIKTGDMTRLTIQMPEGFPKILTLHFMTCTATADDDTSITINTVKDGCALDAIDSADASTSANAISYTYTAFAFSEFEALTIRCESKICLNSEVREECLEMEDTCAEGYTNIF